MTNKEITSLALKVFAIYVLLQAILSVPLLVNALATYGFNLNRDSNSLLLWFLGATSFILLVTLTVFLWNLANKVVTQTSYRIDKSENSTIDESFFISLLGLYLVFEGILQFGYACTSAFMQMQEASDISALTISYLVVYLIQVTLGLTLIFKAEGWVRFLKWLRVAGLKGKS